MSEEIKKNTQSFESENSETDTGQGNKSKAAKKVDEQNAAAERMAKASKELIRINEETIRLNREKAEKIAEEVLGGGSEGGSGNKEEETPKEYKDRIMTGNFNFK